MTTACIIIETDSLGPKLVGTAKVLKDFRVHKCGHEKNPLSASNCIKSICKQSHYIIATQDRELQDQLRLKVGVPLLYLHNAAPTLEQPSEASQRIANKKTKTVLNVSQTEAERLKFLKAKEGLVQDETPRLKRRKKKGGPNPLSCKKKKPKGTNQHQTKVKAGGVEKKRKRIKVPKHVKEILSKNETK